MPRCAWLFLLLCPLTGCASKELTRSKATELIKKGLGFPKQIVWPFTIGLIGKNTLDAKIYRLLDEDQMVTVTPVGARCLLVRLTDKGKQYLSNPKTSRDDSLVAEMKLCSQQFDEIATISYDWERKHAQVDFVIRIQDLTPFGKREQDVMGHGAGCDPSWVVSSSVPMTLYSDGWRIGQ